MSRTEQTVVVRAGRRHVAANSASIAGREHEVLTVLADPRDEALWVALQVGDTRVQIPLDILRKALEVAAEDVHSAAWFARQDGDASGL